MADYSLVTAVCEVNTMSTTILTTGKVSIGSTADLDRNFVPNDNVGKPADDVLVKALISEMLPGAFTTIKEILAVDAVEVVADSNSAPLSGCKRRAEVGVENAAPEVATKKKSETVSCSVCRRTVLLDTFHKCDECDLKICESCIDSSCGMIAYCQGCVASACMNCFGCAGFRDCPVCFDLTCSDCAPSSAPSGCFTCSHGLVVRSGNRMTVSAAWKTYPENAKAQKARDLAAASSAVSAK